MSENKKLTAKQELFCKEYLIDLNAKQAAIRAGYSEKTAKEVGYENLTKPYLQEKIQKLKQKREERLEINADWVLKQAVKVHQLCLSEEKYDASNALKALDTVGKHVNIQAFKEKVDVEQNVNLDMSDSELGKKILFALNKSK